MSSKGMRSSSAQPHAGSNNQGFLPTLEPSLLIPPLALADYGETAYSFTPMTLYD